MAWISIQTEIQRLERDWSSVLNDLPPAQRTASETLLERIDLGRGRAEAWTGLFAPWTLLYPLLQAEGFDDAELHQASRLTLAHLQMLIHAFVEDRRLDGQLRLSDSELNFSRSMYDLAMNRLNDELPDHFPSHPYVQSLLESHWRAQAMDWSADNGGFSAASPWDRSHVVLTARGRAAYGYVAPLAVLLAARVDKSSLGKAAGAYDALVTGLQWGDDIEDWKDDWKAGRQNLLLTGLGQVEGMTASEIQGLKDVRLLEKKLTDHGLFEAAFANAIGCFESAGRVHQELGCRQLASMLEFLVDKARLHAERLDGNAEPPS